MLYSIGAINQSRGFNFEQLDIQLATVEILLDVAERSGSTAAIKRALSEYALVSERYVSRATSTETELVQERLTDIEARLSRLSQSVPTTSDDSG